MISCAVFDFDDTLVASEEYKLQAFYDIAERFKNGSSLMAKIFADPNRGDRFDIMKTFASYFASNVQDLADELVKEYSFNVENFITTCPEIRGAEATLYKLKNLGIKLYINSATPKESLRVSIKKRKWDIFFEDVLGRPETKLENLNTIAKTGFFAPENMVMVGDGENDREAAEDFGCFFVGIKAKSAKYKESVKFIADDMAAVFNIITAF